MMHVLWRVAIAAFCYVVFIYITPLFLEVLQVSLEGSLWSLIKALAAVAAIAYVIWGPTRYPWGG